MSDKRIQSTMGDLEQKWNDLCDWIVHGGGKVHPALALRPISSADHRGIFAETDISQGELLIELPRHLALDGSSRPESYEVESKERQASPWLRCLTSYFIAQKQLQNGAIASGGTVSHACYLKTLPSSYETVSISWTKEEIESFLSGTSSQGIGEIGADWHMNFELVRGRYLGQVRPYLVYCSVLTQEVDDVESEIREFLHASQCLSTRCFHLQQTQSTASPLETESSSSYTGPYLLPLIDLLNHSTYPESRCTTLESNGASFIMKAERPISAGEEILHSYGNDLTISQFLQTFGFIEEKLLHDLTLPPSASKSTLAYFPSPVIVSKHLILDACWQVVESGYPERLGQAMEQAEMEDEIWAVKVDKKRGTQNPLIPDPLLIDRTNLLSDELVTVACLPFLPGCACREAGRSLLGREILEDYFLGNLVAKSLLQAIQMRLEAYKPIVWNDSQKSNDAEFLKELLDSSDKKSDHGRRASYGLALRIDEKATLEALRHEVLQIIVFLEESSTDQEMMNDDDSPTKRTKIDTL